MDELKPCPFCGWKHINTFIEDFFCWRCECHRCGASVKGMNRKDAEDAWNRRVEDAAD